MFGLVRFVFCRKPWFCRCWHRWSDNLQGQRGPTQTFWNSLTLPCWQSQFPPACLLWNTGKNRIQGAAGQNRAFCESFALSKPRMIVKRKPVCLESISRLLYDLQERTSHTPQHDHPAFFTQILSMDNLGYNLTVTHRCAGTDILIAVPPMSSAGGRNPDRISSRARGYRTMGLHQQASHCWTVTAHLTDLFQDVKNNLNLRHRELRQANKPGKC